MTSILKVSEIQDPTNSNTAISIDSSGKALMPGHVVQVVSATKTSKFTTTSTSYTTITGLSVTITPSSTSSKILVSFDLNAGVVAALGAIRLYRDATAIAIGDAINEPANNRITVNVYNGGDDANSTPNVSMSTLDAPNSTSAITYELKAGCVQGSGTIVVNDQTSQVRGQTYSGVTASTITVMEIAQ